MYILFLFILCNIILFLLEFLLNYWYELLSIDFELMYDYHVRLSELDHQFLKNIDLYKYFKTPKSFLNLKYNSYDKIMNVSKSYHLNNINLGID